MTITYERAHEIWSYDPETGEFRWRVQASNGVRIGGLVGENVDSRGYHRLQVGGRRYKAHRIAWLMMTGAEAPLGIDHINGKPGDNRWGNLRLATQAQNLQNTAIRRNNASGYPGVHWFKHLKKWRAKIMLNRVEHTLGYFDDPAEAAEAYRKAKAELHTFQPAVRVAA